MNIKSKYRNDIIIRKKINNINIFQNNFIKYNGNIENTIKNSTEDIITIYNGNNHINKIYKMDENIRILNRKREMQWNRVREIFNNYSLNNDYLWKLFRIMKGHRDIIEIDNKKMIKEYNNYVISITHKLNDKYINEIIMNENINIDKRDIDQIVNDDTLIRIINNLNNNKSVKGEIKIIHIKNQYNDINNNEYRIFI